MHKKLIYIICLIFYIIIAFITEIFYRNTLYDKSIEYTKQIKQDGFFHYFYYFWSNIFFYGMIAFGLIITFLLYPINIFYSHMAIILFLILIMCILKSLYSNSRPYWDIYLSKQEKCTTKCLPDPTECDGEFGNPSGHALLSSYILILWDLFINSDFFKNLGKKNNYL